MPKPALTIFYQFNPWNSTLGGIQTIIKTFIKYAPPEFEVRLVGTAVDPGETIGKWQKGELFGKELHFFPLFLLQNDDHRSRIPTTVKYTAALLKQHFTSDFMHFHRLEPTLAALNWSGDKTLFIHNDIRQQMEAKGNKQAILWRRFPSVYFALEGLLVKQFTQIFSCNSESAALYRQQYPQLADRVSYFRNTVDDEIFYPLPAEERQQQQQELAKKLGLLENTRFLLFAGRLHPQKDPILLIRSFAALNDPNTHLLIAGDGELINDVRAEINELNLNQRVTLLGSLSQTELAQLHQVCAAVILTSEYEGLPLVVLEALACGTPIVTTQCGETPNLLSATSGIVCEERTPKAIASALSKVLNSHNYSSQSCLQVVQPFIARKVISDVYSDMFDRWQQRTSFSETSAKSVHFV